MIKTAKRFLVALSILPFQYAQAHNWLPTETNLKDLKEGNKSSQNDPLIVVSDPIAEAINIRFIALKDETYVVHLINESGSEISRQYRFLGEGENSIEIKTHNIPIGSYHVRIENEFQSEMGKLWVQK